MVQITNVEKEAINDYGVDIAVTISTKEPKKEDFIKYENFTLANELYAKTADHINSNDIIELTSSAMSTYDPNVIATIFDKLVKLDQQSYYDALSILQSIVLAKDLDNRTKFLDDIRHVSDENYAPEIVEEDSVIEDDEGHTIIDEDNSEETSETDTSSEKDE